jgi:hypothetical protein
MKKLISIVLAVTLITTSVPPKAAEASFFTDLMGGFFTILTAPIWVFCPNNPTFRKNNPFRKKVWEEERDSFSKKTTFNQNHQAPITPSSSSSRGNAERGGYYENTEDTNVSSSPFDDGKAKSSTRIPNSSNKTPPCPNPQVEAQRAAAQGRLKYEARKAEAHGNNEKSVRERMATIAKLEAEQGRLKYEARKAKAHGNNEKSVRERMYSFIEHIKQKKWYYITAATVIVVTYIVYRHYRQAQRPPAEGPPDEIIVDPPPADPPPAENPPAENPPAENPPDGNPPDGNPPDGNPPDADPPPAGGPPPVENPAAEAPTS